MICFSIKVVITCHWGLLWFRGQHGVWTVMYVSNKQGKNRFIGLSSDFSPHVNLKDFR
jgi:hypothetical protein